jgi:hypothetical protein
MDQAVRKYKKEKEKQIAIKHRSVQAYEAKYPGLSQAWCG